MQTTIHTKPLAAALAVIHKNVHNRHVSVPIYNQVTVGAVNGHCDLSAFNGDLHVNVRIQDTETGLPGLAVMQDAADVHRFLKSLPKGGECVINSDGENVTIKDAEKGIAKATFPTFNSEDLPKLDLGDVVARFSLQSTEIQTIFNDVAWAISSEETRYYLNGVHLHTTGDPTESMVTAVATDGHRMSVCELMPWAHPRADVKVIVPTLFWNTLKQVVKKDTTGGVDFTLYDNHVTAVFGDTTITSKLIAGTYPDYPRVIPDGADSHLTLQTADLLDFCKMVTVGIPKSQRVVMSLEVDVKHGTTMLGHLNNEGRDYSLEIPSQFDTLNEKYTESFAVGFNARYMVDLLNSVKDDHVTFDFVCPASPMTVRPNSQQTFVLMPMRL